MASKPLLIIDRNIPYLQGVLEPFARVEYADFFTNESVKNADGLLIRTRTHVNETLLANSNVKFIASATIGFDHIDLNFCKKNGIAVFNAPGCNAGSVQQFIASVLMNLLKKDQKFGEITLGIVGVGHTGSKVKQFAEAIGMKVLLNDPPRQRKENNDDFASLEDVLSGSDIISFHVPLTYEGEDATYEILSGKNYSLIKSGAVIINASRGEVCNEEILKELVREKDCTLVLDVWQHEPICDRELISLSKITTPHIAGYSADGKANASRIIALKTAEFFGFDLEKTSSLEPPLPENNLIFPEYGSFEKIISECVLQTYNVLQDSEFLKTNPGAFETLRNSYPLRREFSAYKVKSANLPADTIQTLIKLGFQTF
jgi:erythronate-4-phosphate dehydrogenase